MTSVFIENERTRISRSIIDQLEQAEFYRSYQTSLSILSDFWNFETDAPLSNEYWSGQNSVFKAAIWQSVGVFLLEYGRGKGFKNYQERAKDVFSRAIELLIEIGDFDNALECRRLLSVAYYHEGSINEYLALLEDAESYFQDRTNITYLRIQANFLIVEISRNEIEEAKQRIAEHLPAVQNCGDPKTQIMFFTQCGIVFRRDGDYLRSLAHYEMSLMFAEETNNLYYVSLIKNSLATNLYHLNRFDEAILAINEALVLAADKPGWIPVFLDTKANMLLAVKDYEAAYNVIIEAIELFRLGDDAGGLAEALWTQTLCEVKLGMPEYAIECFVELYQIVLAADGLAAARQYLSKFVKLFYLYDQGEGQYFNEIDKFSRFLIQNTLFETDGNITQSAGKLKMSEKTLSKKIRTKYPDLKKDFPRLNLRKIRSDAHKKKNRTQT